MWWFGGEINGGGGWFGWLWVLLYIIASMLYTWFFHTVQYTPLWGNRSYSYLNDPISIYLHIYLSTLLQ